jgi:hypothetical protein
VFDYFKLGENDQYLFLQLPLMLIKDDMFKDLSSDAKILYSLLLNRTSLSAKNGWVDEDNNIYIIYTIEQIMEDLNCWERKAVKLMSDLKDIGLVKTIRRGLGKPNITYVMNFATALNLKNAEKARNCTDLSKGQFKDCHNDNSRIVKSTIQDLSKGQSSNINISNIDFSDIDFSQSSQSSHSRTGENEEKHDMTDSITDTQSYESYERLIKSNISYDHYVKHSPADIEMIDGLVQIMLDVICTHDPPTVRIGNETKSRGIVKSVYLKLDSEHIRHVIDQYKQQRNKITNKTAYLQKMLYTVWQEIDAHYTNAVRSDGVVR